MGFGDFGAPGFGAGFGTGPGAPDGFNASNLGGGFGFGGIGGTSQPVGMGQPVGFGSVPAAGPMAGGPAMGCMSSPAAPPTVRPVIKGNGSVHMETMIGPFRHDLTDGSSTIVYGNPSGSPRMISRNGRTSLEIDSGPWRIDLGNPGGRWDMPL